MIDPKEIKVGDLVQVVDRWTRNCIEPDSGEMDRWLGQIVTIRSIWQLDKKRFRIRIKEDAGDDPFGGDGNRWEWNQYMFNPIEEDDIPLIPAASDEDILSLFS